MAVDRGDRLSEELRREISDVIRNELKDPRLSDMISIVSCEVQRDLEIARVRVSIYGDDQARADGMKALKSAEGFIRRSLGRKMTVRRIPKLVFTLDTSIEYSVRIAGLLREIEEQEKKKENPT